MHSLNELPDQRTQLIHERQQHRGRHPNQDDCDQKELEHRIAQTAGESFHDSCSLAVLNCPGITEFYFTPSTHWPQP